MQMTNDEIVMRYKQAKSKGDQVQILAELNDCPVERIIGILTSAGIDNRNFNRLRAKLEKHEPQKEQAGAEEQPEADELPPMDRRFPVEVAKELSKTVEKAHQESYYCEELFEPIRKEVAALMDKRRGIYAELRNVDAELAKYVEFFSAQMLQIDTLRKDGDDNECNQN